MTGENRSGGRSSGSRTDEHPLIAVRDVDVSLGGVRVLDGVSLSVARGEFVGLVGPNGAGKTTVLRTVNGALAPEAGRVTVDGADVADLSSRAVSRRVATVPQDTGVRFAFTVADVVAMGRTPYRSRFARDPEASEHVERALERTDTARLRDRRVDTLSGGERQRVYVARALAQDAPALVLDEPTASLDVNHATRTLSLVRDLADEGRAALAAIHDLEAAARYCDRLVLLHDGRVRARGPPASVLTADALAATFDVEAAVTADPVTGTPNVTPLPALPDGGRRVHVFGGGRVGARVVGRLWGAGHDVTAGPMAIGDAAADVARALDVPVQTVPPFTPLAECSLAATRERVRAADVAVLADVDVVTPTVQGDLVDEADSLVLLEERPLSARNHAGRAGRRVVERWRAMATAADPDGVAAAVDRAAGRRPVPTGERPDGST